MAGKLYMQLPQDEYGNVGLPWYVLRGVVVEKYRAGRPVLVIEEPVDVAAVHPDLSWPVYETSDPGPARRITIEEYLAILERDGVALPVVSGGLCWHEQDPVQR